jgi:hypothetical protein
VTFILLCVISNLFTLPGFWIVGSKSFIYDWLNIILISWILRVYFNAAPSLREHFQKLGKESKLPPFQDLLTHSKILSERYTSEEAILHALKPKEYQQQDTEMKIPAGSPWTPPTSSNSADGIQSHVEQPGFNGDRVLVNEMLFLRDFGYWAEADYAVPIGDVGRLTEVLKVCF